MKFDMHCHTREGSMDAQVVIEDYIRRLKQLGFGGMLVSDHNSYDGYRQWKDSIRGKRHHDFVVLKGVEYDTIDCGHILVIMPEGIKLRILEMRGLPAHLLVKIVHHYGGILGPAHPCGERYLSFATTKMKKGQPVRIMKEFDFVEIFNSCEEPEDNAAAAKLAQRYHKPGFGGSDSHKTDNIGKAYTELPDWIKKESDLIRYVRSNPKIRCGGTYYKRRTKDRLGKLNALLVQSFYFYNKLGGIVRSRKRKNELKKIFDINSTRT